MQDTPDEVLIERGTLLAELKRQNTIVDEIEGAIDLLEEALSGVLRKNDLCRADNEGYEPVSPHAGTIKIQNDKLERSLDRINTLRALVDA